MLFVPALIGLVSAVPADPWPEWRGPTRNGISTETDLPIAWSAERNIAWKTPLPGRSASTPIVWGGRVFLTAQRGEGPIAYDFDEEAPESEPDNFEVQLSILCHAAADGRLLWEREAPNDLLVPTRDRHNLATPSCVTDGERVYAWFGNGSLTCFDFAGNVIWRRHLGREFAPLTIDWGHGSSPTIYNDSLILLCDHEPASYILAVNKRTGETVWKADRDPGRSYTTPIFVKVGGRDEMIVNAAKRIDAFDPRSGEFLWTARGLRSVVVPTPVAAHGMVYTYGGAYNAPMMAIRPGGRGDVTETHVVWRKKNEGPYVPSPLCVGDDLFTVGDNGFASCYDARSGKLIWRERLGGNFSSSPVFADGNIYVISEWGETVVFAASRDFNLVSRNPLDEPTLASLAVSDGRIFIRTEKNLYGIGGAD